MHDAMGERSKGQKPLLGGLSGFLGHLDRTISCSIEVFGPSGASPCQLDRPGRL